MVSFLSTFKSQAASVLVALKVIRLELTKAQHDIEGLLVTERNLPNGRLPESIVAAIRDDFGVAFWVKDQNHRYIFANKVCCAFILRCRENGAESLTKEDLEKNELVIQCIKNDKVVIKNQKTMRFIAYVIYKDGSEVFLDVVKSPRFCGEEVIGTVGSGVIITESIPVDIRKQNRKSNCIEIPVNSSMGSRTLIEVLERRKFSRIKNDDEKYQRRRRFLSRERRGES